MTRCTIPLAPEGSRPAPYTVRVHLLGGEKPESGACVLPMALQGREVLKDLDLGKGGRSAVVRTFSGIMAKDELTVSFEGSGRAVALCGIEIAAGHP